jgi:hypothetical protein
LRLGELIAEKSARATSLRDVLGRARAQLAVTAPEPRGGATDAPGAGARAAGQSP